MPSRSKLLDRAAAEDFAKECFALLGVVRSFCIHWLRQKHRTLCGKFAASHIYLSFKAILKKRIDRAAVGMLHPPRRVGQKPSQSQA